MENTGIRDEVIQEIYTLAENIISRKYFVKLWRLKIYDMSPKSQ